MNFWNDNWLGESISDQLAIPPSFRKNLKAKISDFYVQNSWHLPHQFKMAFPMLSADIENVTFSYSAEDSFVFCPSKNGQVSCKVFYHFYRPNRSRVAWGRDLWRHYLPPSRSFLLWRAIHLALPTEDVLQQRGQIFPSRCCLCFAHSESLDHIFCSCLYASSL